MKIICKERLEIANHTRQHVYSLGRIYRPTNKFYSIDPLSGDVPIDFEQSYTVLSRLLIAMNGDDISIYIDDSSEEPKYSDDNYQFFSAFWIHSNIDQIISELSSGKQLRQLY